MAVLQTQKVRTRKPQRVVMCESFDQRVLRAANMLSEHKIAQIVLLGNYDELDRAAVGYRGTIDGMEVLDYESGQMQKGISDGLKSLGTAGDFDPTDPTVAGAWLVRNGVADAVIAGAATTPTHVMRVFLKLLGVAEDCRTMSGMSIVSFENCEFVRSKSVGMADVSVVADPSVEQLADIAIQAAASYERISQTTARVAFLSYSTAGSSDLPSAKKVRAAIELTRSRRPDLAVDGEMQIDAALVPSAAGVKFPASNVAGSANVLVFPNLDAGNIAVKIFQKFSDYRVIGPIIQGLKHPCTYIPRASSAEDIVDQVRLLVE